MVVVTCSGDGYCTENSETTVLRLSPFCPAKKVSPNMGTKDGWFTSKSENSHANSRYISHVSKIQSDNTQKSGSSSHKLVVPFLRAEDLGKKRNLPTGLCQQPPSQILWWRLEEKGETRLSKIHINDGKQTITATRKFLVAVIRRVRTTANQKFRVAVVFIGTVNRHSKISGSGYTEGLRCTKNIVLSK